MYYYVRRKDDSAVMAELNQLADKHQREGQDKFYRRLRQKGFLWNYKRVRRVYRLMGLNLRLKRRKRLPRRVCEPLQVPASINHVWSLDFMHDSLSNGRKFRILNIIDDYNREALIIEPQFSFPANSVIMILNELLRESGKPLKIRTDNGPEFISGIFEQWCEDHNITLEHIPPGKPYKNGYIERFNRSFREHVLDAYLFESIYQASNIFEQWREDYNEYRPHESLNHLSPKQYKNTNMIAEVL